MAVAVVVVVVVSGIFSSSSAAAASSVAHALQSLLSVTVINFPLLLVDVFNWGQPSVSIIQKVLEIIH